MARPGVRRIGIEKRGDFVVQGKQAAFSRIVLAQMPRQVCRRRRLDRRSPAYRVGAVTEGGQISREPIRRDLPIRIGGKQNIAFCQATSRFPHSKAPRGAGIRRRAVQLAFDTVAGNAKRGRDASQLRRRAIGAVVEQQHDPVRARAGLTREGGKAGGDGFRLIAYWNSNDSTLPDDGH